ncbi:MAG: hypothetical protein AB1374_13435, partial [Bacillota bacterium]
MPGEKRLLLIVFLLMVALMLSVMTNNYLTYAVSEDTYGSIPDSTDEDPAPSGGDGFAPSGPDTDPPSQPTGLTVTDPGTGDALCLRWNTNTEEDLLGYRVYRSVSSETYAPPDESYQRLGSGSVDTADTDY